MFVRMCEKVARKLRSEGLSGLLRAVSKQARGGRIRQFHRVESVLQGKNGLEIGGPSNLMFGKGRLLPIYPIANCIDNCNFASNTIWEEAIQEGLTFRFDEGRNPGRQFILDAT